MSRSIKNRQVKRLPSMGECFKKGFSRGLEAFAIASQEQTLPKKSMIKGHSENFWIAQIEQIMETRKMNGARRTAYHTAHFVAQNSASIRAAFSEYKSTLRGFTEINPAQPAAAQGAYNAFDASPA